jgi:hypothetical protein
MLEKLRRQDNVCLIKIYFNEFVANVLLDVIGIVIFDLRGHGGC